MACPPKWGTYRNGDGRFNYPYGVAVRQKVILSLLALLVPAFKWGTKGSEDDQFYYPHGVAVAGEGNVMVAENWNHRIQVFSCDGTFLIKWGTRGSGIIFSFLSTIFFCLPSSVQQIKTALFRVECLSHGLSRPFYSHR